MKRLIFLCLYVLGIHHLVRWWKRKQVTILCYHGFARVGEAPASSIENYQGKHLPIEIFRRQLKYLKKYYHLLSLEDFLAYRRRGAPFPERSLVVTFDDGYRSTYSLAYPLLRELQVPVTIFLTSDSLEKREPLWVDRVEYAVDRTSLQTIELPWENYPETFPLGHRTAKVACETKLRSWLKAVAQEKREELLLQLEGLLETALRLENSPPEVYELLSWEEVKEMASSGWVSLGSHTASHPILTRCSYETMRREILYSKETIEKQTGFPCVTFAYPNGQPGDFDYRTRSLLQELGYACGLTTVEGWNGLESDLFELKRFGTSSDFLQFVMNVSGVATLLSQVKRAFHGQESAVIQSFDEQAASYADGYCDGTSLAHSFQIRRKRVCQLLGGLPGGRVLDIGCGPGVMVEPLRGRGFEYYGVDLSSGMIGQCLKKFGRLPKTHFSVGRIEALDFPDGFFDAVVSMGVVEYLADDSLAVREMARMAKLGGTVVITLPHQWSPYRIWDRTVFDFCYRRFGRFLKRLLRHPVGVLLKHREYTEAAYTRLLSTHGLHVEDVLYYNFKLIPAPFDRWFPGMTVRLSERLERLCRSRMRWLGTGFIVKTTKRPDRVPVPPKIPQKVLA